MMALAQTARQFESLIALAFARYFSGEQQGIGDTGHGGDNHHGTPL
jgi:hypothetical protein